MNAIEEAFERLKRELNQNCADQLHASRRELTRELNQSMRRFRSYQTQAEWISTLLEAALRFARQVALFSVGDAGLVLRSQSQFNLPDNLSFPLASAGAFAYAAETKEPVVAMRRASEIGDALNRSTDTDRAHLFPITNEGRVVAVLFASEDEDTDISALELIAGMAASVLERRSNVRLHAQIAAAPAPSTMANRPGTATAPNLPAWADLDESQRNLHFGAQRFARIRVAEMQLARPEACRAGREQASFYIFLKKEIDTARETYRTRFITIPSMVDYLHAELVRAAEGDERKLGADYPGQLV